jgi:hypothetical protein
MQEDLEVCVNTDGETVATHGFYPSLYLYSNNKERSVSMVSYVMFSLVRSRCSSVLLTWSILDPIWSTATGHELSSCLQIWSDRLPHNLTRNRATATVATNDNHGSAAPVSPKKILDRSSLWRGCTSGKILDSTWEPRWRGVPGHRREG